MRITLSDDERFLEVAFAEPMRTLSWALVGAGFGEHERVVWHFVRRGELPHDVDAHALLRERMAERGYARALGFLTARYLRPYADVRVHVGDVIARAIVTVGLGNALAAGDPPARAVPVGTINVLAVVSAPLSDAALVEAIALASEARTAALLTFAVPSVVSGEPATGTGTDCIAVASPACATGALAYAGKHTDVGAALGRSVREATERATREWLRENTAAQQQSA